MPSWFKQRTYRHFDVPVGDAFAVKAQDRSFVATHSFVPLIRYIKETKRYLPKERKTEIKPRKIMFASHRDSCILSYYNFVLSKALEQHYSNASLGGNVIAYRKLGKGNYHFAAEAQRFALDNTPCAILAFDVSKFFDTLNHSLLKQRLKQILCVTELTNDWYAVYRHVTKFHYVEKADLESNTTIRDRLKVVNGSPIATMAEVKSFGIPIGSNPDIFGIPQGTPISSTLANLYMIDFDRKVKAKVEGLGGFYRRYSDDILAICPPDTTSEIEEFIVDCLTSEHLGISAHKTERSLFAVGSQSHAQYLGFTLATDGVSIRPSSLSRQWRKLRWAVKRTMKAGQAAISRGVATKIYTKRLRKRFSPVQTRNFSSYARRSSDILGNRKIRRQRLRLERELDRIIRGFT